MSETLLQDPLSRRGQEAIADHEWFAEALDAVARLGVLGEPALRLARVELDGPRATPIVVAARALVRYGAPTDRGVVADRLRRKLPMAAAEPKRLAYPPVMAALASATSLSVGPPLAMRCSSPSTSLSVATVSAVLVKVWATNAPGRLSRSKDELAP